ncbi:MAG: hypothetical protein AAF696_03485 [Bacteroidota bacterium]
MKKENIKPLIERFNPYFSNHIYKSTTQTELAKMGKHRLLVVKQSGCKRHHINFNLLIEADAVIDDKEFWIAEAKALLHKVFYKGSDYARLGPKFDKLFEEKFKMYGMKRKFNFPIGTRNFICQVVNDPEKGGQIAIEMVSYIFRERVEVKRRRISLDKDDGWKAVDGN